MKNRCVRSYKPLFFKNPNLQIPLRAYIQLCERKRYKYLRIFIFITAQYTTIISFYFPLTRAPLVTAGMAEPAAAACDGGGADYDDCGGCGGSDGG